MYEDDVKELNKWFADKERAYDTGFNGQEYVVSEVDVEDFCEQRYALAMEAKEFFMKILNADCDRICIENPRPLNIVGLPAESQRIQPYEFGEPWSKLTYLWLKGLPPLMATLFVADHKPYVSCGTSRNKGRKDKAGHSRAGGAQKVRSKTFPGIAKAMAEQWGVIP